VDERAACRPFAFMWRDALGLAEEGHDPRELLQVPSSVWLCRWVCGGVLWVASVNMCACVHALVGGRACAVWRCVLWLCGCAHLRVEFYAPVRSLFTSSKAPTLHALDRAGPLGLYPHPPPHPPQAVPVRRAALHGAAAGGGRRAADLRRRARARRLGGDGIRGRCAHLAATGATWVAQGVPGDRQCVAVCLYTTSMH
jgi:hypothetical protein